MSEVSRWLDELPADCPDRALLAAGRAARSPKGSEDHTWSALVAVLGAASTVATTAHATAATTVAAQATAVAAKTTTAASIAVGATQASAAQGIFASIATSLGVKSVAVGFAIGMGVIGIGEVAVRVSHPASQPASQPAQSLPSTVASSRAVRRLPTPGAVVPALAQSASVQGVRLEASPESLPVPDLPTAEPVENPERPLPSASPRRTDPLNPRPLVVQQLPLTLPTHTSVGTSSPTVESEITSRAETAAAKAPKPNSLADQARGLARIQRLLDAGDTAEAIRQLEASLSVTDYSSLVEERDALYVQALVRAQRIAQANMWAKRFMQRYPNSPHVEEMRRQVEGK